MFQVVHTYEGHQADVHLLLPFGDHLISVDKENAVIIWDVESEGKVVSVGYCKLWALNLIIIDTQTLSVQ